MSDRTRLGARHRPRDARRARHADQDVLRLRRQQGRRAQRAHLPGVPRAPRRAARAQQARRRVRRAHRAGAQLHRAAAQHLPPQELLLSRPAQGVPDQPVRRAARHRRAGSSTGWTASSCAAASTGCTWRRTPPSSSTPAATPGRIAGSDYSMVDFNRGGTPLIEIVTEPDIPSPEAAREFLQQLRNLVVELGVSECNMEEGQIRWDANISVRPEGSAGARHAHRAQEHEQLPLPAAGARRGDPAADRAPRGRREDRPGDAALRPRHGHDDAAAQQGRGARLPLLPRARPGAARHRPGVGRASCARRSRSCRRRAWSASSAQYGLSRADATVLGSVRRARRLLRRSRGGRGRRQAGGQLGDGRVPRPSQRRRPRGRPRPRHRRAPRPAGQARRGRRPSRRAPPRTSSRS